MSAEPRKPFKDYFDCDAAVRLAGQVAAAWPDFDEAAFTRRATRGLGGLEFQARVQQFSDALAAGLPDDRAEALRILTRSLPPALPDCEALTDGWLQWPLGQFIADHGLPHLDDAMTAMIELTRRFSSEFAVRPFLIKRPDEVYPRLVELTAHPCPHVRRWCSEGSRPRLPWGRQLAAVVKDPSPSWPILDALRDDPEPYVRKSVANHLNDIARDHPDLVIRRARAWRKNATPARTWIIRHGLRTLVKQGHPDALALLGFDPGAALEASLTPSPKTLAIGESTALAARIRNPGTTPVCIAVDYRVHFVRPSGRPSMKVFKWTAAEIPAGKTVALKKTHPFRHASIRTLHPGRHRIQLQVNGAILAEASVRLT